VVPPGVLNKTRSRDSAQQPSTQQITSQQPRSDPVGFLNTW
jgi:hypothetical protein